jgi:hypothetical protein
LLHFRDLFLQASRVCSVIGIEASDKAPARRIEPGVQGLRKTEPLGVHDPYSWVAIVSLEESDGTVGGMIIHDDNLEVLKCLGANAFHCLSDEGPAVSHRNEDRNGWCVA